MHISERIFSRRSALGLSKAALGKAIGVSGVSVGKWESGLNQPKGRYLNELAAALGVTVEWLLTGNDEKPGVVVGSIGSGKTNTALMQHLKGMDAEKRAALLSHLESNNLVLMDEAHIPQSVTEKQAGFSNVEPAVIPQGRRVPILSYVQAGNWREMCEQASGFDGNVEYVSASVEIGPCGFGLWVRGNSMEPRFTEGDLLIADPDVVPKPGDYVIAKNGSEEATFKKYRPRGYNDAGQEVFELTPLNDDYPVMRSDVCPISIIATVIEHRAFFKR